MSQGWRRRLATGTNAGIVTVLVVAIAVLLVDVAGRYRVRIDLTEDAAATLQPETIAALAALERQKGTMEVVAFSSQKRNQEAWYRDRTVKDLLRELELLSPNVETRFVDFDRDRLTAEAYGITQYGTIVVRGLGDRVDIAERDVFRRRGGKPPVSEFLGEAAVSRAISQILSKDARTVYVLEGHGEKRISEAGPNGIKELVTLLEKEGMDVEKLDLLRDAKGGMPKVPDDAEAVLLVGPTAPLTPEEEQVLQEYVGDGGDLGVFLDPGGYVPRLVELLGVIRPSGVVLDTVAVFPHEDRPLLRYGRHGITEDLLEGNVATVVAHAAPLEVQAQDGITSSRLLQTSRSGWIERGTERPAVHDPTEDGGGPVTVGVALEVRKPSPLMRPGNVSRVVVVGDSDLLRDDLLTEAPGNATFGVNVVRWLAGEDERMSRVGRPGRVRKLALSQAQLGTIRWLVMGGMPLIAILGGAVVWFTRRDR